MTQSTRIKVAVDAMGGDYGHGTIVEGAIEAARRFNVAVILVGDESLIKDELKKHEVEGLPISVVHAEDHIKMDEQPTQAVRKKKNASINIAIRLAKEGKASAVMSAGHTGASMAAALFGFGRLPGISRPALAVVMPTADGSNTVFLDVGANVDCKPRQLEEFAIMGEVYASMVLDVDKPRVGLLSIGSESSKGNEVSLQTYKLMEKLPLNFIGNVEGREIVNGKADVVVCDGFVGNVSLKLGEGMADLILKSLKQCFKSTWRTKLGAYILKPALIEFKRRFDYSEYGGAPLLGLRGNCVIAHGGSNPKAIMNAIRFSAKQAEKKVDLHIEENVEQYLGKEDSCKMPGLRA